MAEVKMPKFPDGFGDNSNKSRKQGPSGKPVTPAEAFQQATMTILEPKKVTLAEKFARLFFEGDIKDALKYMGKIMVDRAKDALVEGFRIWIRGGGAQTSNPYTYYDNPSYSYYYNSGTNYQAPQQSKKPAKPPGEVFDPRRVVFSNAETVQFIINDLREQIRQSGSASVSDFFNFARRRTKNPEGVPSLPVPDWASVDFGWVNVDSAHPATCKGGYYCALPDPYPIS